MPKQKQTKMTSYFPKSQVQLARTIAQGAKLAYKGYSSYTDWKKNSNKQQVASRNRSGKSYTKTTYKRKKEDGNNSYTQWDTKNRKSTLSKNLTLVKQMNRIIKSNQEKLIFRWNGVKNFDDNGYYWLFNNLQAEGTRRYMPMYFFDLTSCINSTRQTGTVPTILYPQPLTRCFIENSTGEVKFDNSVHYEADGTTQTADLQLERGSYGGGTDGSGLNHILPHNKDILKWVNIKLNCWGAKARSTKFTISIVRFKDHELQPTPFISANEKRNGLFQSLLKPIAHNPISMTGSDMRKYMKVLRSETFLIQPTSTTETDQDPHVRTLKWFCKFNRLIDYAQRENVLNRAVDVVDESDFAVNIGNQNSSYAESTKRLYLMISATNYGLDSTGESPTNVETPSFDLAVRMCHTTMA